MAYGRMCTCICRQNKNKRFIRWCGEAWGKKRLILRGGRKMEAGKPLDGGAGKPLEEGADKPLEGADKPLEGGADKPLEG